MSNPQRTQALDFSEIGQRVAQYDPDARESVKRQITAVQPVRWVWQTTRKSQLMKDLSEAKRRLYQQGATGLIESPEGLHEMARIIAKLKYGSKHYLINDLGNGLYSAITRPHSTAKFEDVQPLYDAKGRIVEWNVIASTEAILKVMLGPLVNDNGRAVDGAGPIVKALKKSILPVLTMAESEPVAGASIHKTKPDGSPINVIVYGRPVRIRYQSRGTYAISLDRMFYPIDKLGETASDAFIHIPAGLYGVLYLGCRVYEERGGPRLKAPDAYKLINYFQAANEINTFAPGIRHVGSNGRINFNCMRIPAVKDLRPSAISSEGRVRFKDFSQFVGDVGEVYWAGLNELGIVDQLHRDTIVPARDRGAEFPREWPQIVYLKADQVGRIR